MTDKKEEIEYIPIASTTKNAAYTQGPIAPTMFKMASHLAVGHLAMSIFNVTDTFFVSQLGTVPLAAMGFTFPIVFLAFTLVFGMGIGVASVASRCVGEGDHHRLKRLTTDAMLFTLLVGITISAIGLPLLRQLLMLMNAEGEALDLASRYLQLWFWAFPLAVLPMVGNNAIRAAGNTKVPAMIMASAALLNLALDPLFIFGFGPIPAMGMTGAAVATIISRYVSVVWAIWILAKPMGLISFSIPKVSEVLDSWKQLLHTALPASATYSMLPLSMYILTSIIAQFGTEATAAMAAATRFEGILLIPVLAMSAILLPFIGQNFGQKQFTRILTAIKISRTFMIVWAVVVTLIMLLAKTPASYIFSDDPAVLKLLPWAMLLLAISHGGVGLGMSASSGLNAIGSPLYAAAVTVCRSILLAVPLAWIGAKIYGPLGVLGGLSAARIVAGIAGERMMVHRIFQKRDENLAAEKAA